MHFRVTIAMFCAFACCNVSAFAATERFIEFLEEESTLLLQSSSSIDVMDPVAEFASDDRSADAWREPFLSTRAFGNTYDSHIAAGDTSATGRPLLGLFWTGNFPAPAEATLRWESPGVLSTETFGFTTYDAAVDVIAEAHVVLRVHELTPGVAVKLPFRWNYLGAAEAPDSGDPEEFAMASGSLDVRIDDTLLLSVTREFQDTVEQEQADGLLEFTPDEVAEDVHIFLRASSRMRIVDPAREISTVGTPPRIQFSELAAANFLGEFTLRVPEPSTLALLLCIAAFGAICRLRTSTNAR